MTNQSDRATERHLTYLHFVSKLMNMIMELLGHKDYIRVLLAVEHKSLRFNQIQKLLKLNPVQVDRAITFLRKGLWIVPLTKSAGSRISVEYSLGKRGAAFLHSFRTFSADVQRQKFAFGPSEAAELQSLYQ